VTEDSLNLFPTTPILRSSYQLQLTQHERRYKVLKTYLLTLIGTTGEFIG